MKIAAVTAPPPIQRVTRGGAASVGTTKNKLKGTSSSAGSTPPTAKKMVKKMKKKRVVTKQSTATANNNKNNNHDPTIDTSPTATITEATDKMPSIFHIPEEQKYDRYAAALAVTEGLRRIRDAEIERQLSHDASRRRGEEAAATATKKKINANVVKKNAESEFLLQSTKAVEALGLTVSQFNEIGREVLADSVLKERVSEQAYLYRMASTINLERVPLLQDPTSKKLLQSPKHKRYRVQMFARSITEIEELRSDQMEALRRSLQVERFPPGFDLSDPNVQPLLHPEVRAVCEKFPVKAEEIVKRYGLESEEFNRMLEETKGNPIFRWRVQKYVEKAEQERRKGKEA
ncbi:hypothetical protein HJC23_002285 [Cyclotella cryptica]|uniref:DUF4168 domain-containing protein n=1 Tax=Cyclotella cryptica TaxID=29204 RepID=A0ABD3QGH5_9STRA